MARGDLQAARNVLARNVRRRRLAKGLTQEGLADAAKLRQAHISEIESSKSNVTLDALQRIALALDTRVAELLDDGKRG